jgi:uncharacterized protein (DUF362 family)
MRKADTAMLHPVSASRRDFIKTVGTAAAGLVAVPYVKASGVTGYNHQQLDGSPATVAVSDTTNTPADSYVYDDAAGGVLQKVKNLLDALDQEQGGAVAALFVKGKKVAIKINLTGGSGSASSSALGGYAITEAMWTHPAVLQAVGQYILDAGVNPTDLYIVESFWDSNWKTPGATVPFGSNDRFGYHAVVQALGCNVVDLNDTTAANIEAVSTGSSHFNFSSITLNKVLQAVDVYVSVPKLKHHSAAGFTGALKNQVGAVPKSLYTIPNDDGRRGAIHHLTSAGTEWTYLPRSICDLHNARPVHLAVIDGIKNSTGGEGVWCTNFAPAARHAIVAGLDPVATDSIGAKLMGLDPEAATFPLPAPISDGSATSSNTDNHLALLNGKGVGTNQLSQILLVGDGTGLLTGVSRGTGPSIPSGFKLSANFPNPFNPSTMIVFSLSHAASVSLRVYDIAGREVETLIQGEVPAGEHRLQWSAQGLASGVYLCRMESGRFSETIRMVYMK